MKKFFVLLIGVSSMISCTSRFWKENTDPHRMTNDIVRKVSIKSARKTTRLLSYTEMASVVLLLSPLTIKTLLVSNLERSYRKIRIVFCIQTIARMYVNLIMN